MKGLVKSDPEKEEPQPNIDCTGDLQVYCKCQFQELVCCVRVSEVHHLFYIRSTFPEYILRSIKGREVHWMRNKKLQEMIR